MATVEIAGDGIALYYGAIVLLVLSWMVFPMRVGVRIWRKAWGMDDYFMLVGIVRKPQSSVAEGDNAHTYVSRSYSPSLLGYVLPAVTMVLDSFPKIYLL
jgi:hypothetical protein